MVPTIVTATAPSRRIGNRVPIRLTRTEDRCVGLPEPTLPSKVLPCGGEHAPLHLPQRPLERRARGLAVPAPTERGRPLRHIHVAERAEAHLDVPVRQLAEQIGRASCRERV